MLALWQRCRQAGWFRELRPRSLQHHSGTTSTTNYTQAWLKCVFSFFRVGLEREKSQAAIFSGHIYHGRGSKLNLTQISWLPMSFTIFFFFFKYHDVNGVTIKDAHWQQVLFTILFASPREHSLLASPYTVITCARDCNLKCIKVSLKCSYTWRVRWDVGRFGDEKQGKPGFIPHVCLHVFCLFVFVFLQRLGDAAEPHHDANGAVRGR